MASPARTRRGGGGSGSSKRGGAWAFLAVLLLVLLRCSPCQGRRLLPEEQGGKVMHFAGGLVLRVSPSPGGEVRSSVAATAQRGFSKAARSMRSVPSPGVGH